jgi:hypothetical protein
VCRHYEWTDPSYVPPDPHEWSEEERARRVAEPCTRARISQPSSAQTTSERFSRAADDTAVVDSYSTCRVLDGLVPERPLRRKSRLSRVAAQLPASFDHALDANAAVLVTCAPGDDTRTLSFSQGAVRA